MLATIGDGYVLLDGQKASPRAIRGQLAASDVSSIANTQEGTWLSKMTPITQRGG